MKAVSQNTEPVLIRKRLNELKLRLKEVASAWTVDNYEALLNFYVRILPTLMDAERCTVYIIEMGSDRICSMLGTGIEKMQIQPPRKGSIAGRVISTGKGIIKNNMERSKGFHTQVDADTGFVTRNSVCCPIRSLTGHGVTGAIQVLNKNGGPFLMANRVLLEEIAGYLSTTIESIMLNQAILQISNQLNREYERFDRGYFIDTPFIAESPAMEETLDLIDSVRKTPVSVLIQGENGTGKELVARLIHGGSNRKNGAFVPVNCSAIPEHLVESEFFGYEKGAFTGAHQMRRGRFEDAHGGTLFLDEIADMPLRIQPKFLRAIQEKEGSRLGNNKLIQYDFRIICASNKNLKTQIRNGNFREDLFFRLFSVAIHLPPLRERKEDIIPLSMAFLEDVIRLFNKKVAGFSPDVLNLFEMYSWPGNIRQLRQEIERLVALTPPGEMIIPRKCSSDLIHAGKHLHGEKTHPDSQLPDQVKALESRLIVNALKKTGGNRVKAAQLLGITRQGLYKKLKRYEIEVL